jgi:hypothetical protein
MIRAIRFGAMGAVIVDAVINTMWRRRSWRRHSGRWRIDTCRHTGKGR